MSLQSLKPHVSNGQLIMDEPTDIPEGSEIELVIANVDYNLNERERECACIALCESPGRARSEAAAVR
jgi:hypothetical protein